MALMKQQYNHKAKSSSLTTPAKVMKSQRLTKGPGNLDKHASKTKNTSKSSSRTAPRSAPSSDKNRHKPTPQPSQYSNNYGKRATQFVC